MILRHVSVAIVAASIVGATKADLVTIGANRDNTLYEDVLGSLSNGAGTGMFAGRSGQDLIRRALISFDVSSAVPAGSTVTDVRLTLHLSRSAGGTNDVSLFRTLAAWGEGTSVAAGEGGTGAAATANDATWVHTFFPAQTWAGAGGGDGGYFAAGSSATLAVGGVSAFYTWQSTGLVSDVQSWVDSPASNFGWTIFGDEEFSGTAKRFDTREHPDAGVRPQLEITFTPIPSPAGGALLACSLVVWPRRRR